MVFRCTVLLSSFSFALNTHRPVLVRGMADVAYVRLKDEGANADPTFASASGCSKVIRAKALLQAGGFRMRLRISCDKWVPGSATRLFRL